LKVHPIGLELGHVSSHSSLPGMDGVHSA
jgi:hypothetical protein